MIGTALFSGSWALLFAMILCVIPAALVWWPLHRPWRRAKFCGAPIPPFYMIAMKRRGVPVAMIVDAYIRATKGGLDLTVYQLEVHYLAGGNLHECFRALHRARLLGSEVCFSAVAIADLAGVDLSEGDAGSLKTASTDPIQAESHIPAAD